MQDFYPKKKEEQVDTLFKFIIVGNASSGKTCLLHYFIEGKHSFHSLQNWVNDVRELANKEVCIVVCGNKSDLTDERAVQSHEAKRQCESLDVEYIETSALTGENVNEAFSIITKTILQKIENHQMEPVFQPRPFTPKPDQFDIDKPTKCSC
ncbi:hypothetical protein ABPG72_017327 [Tetrahymena utriculariae]